MKIFNWVNKTHNLLKDGLARNVKKTDSITIDTNSKALLDHVALFELLDGWRYGVLTIKTFGFYTLKSFGRKKAHLASENDDDEEVKDEDEDSNSEEEVNPLLLGHSFEDHSAKRRKRTTLADLFYQESDMKNNPTSLGVELNTCKKEPSFANKFAPRVGKDSSPIKMLNKRMLKKKIHPEHERMHNKREGPMQALF
ncbi:hypothetical protein F3Y22_tig00112738pilonHSYRG01007 [Hibiscus syriacus]|uniref:Protein TILLER ANGLE CONTROL 1 n=1 Tax=Hibiscus syriacus TaxID=106335 RepID=A0A6A2Y6U0_HIBSY|nr:protein TILLER ANGLE CONTROL 1-like isoform X2 [Hibiscus syriacus]KAE8664914.1 hypothetical protein F3Y22_tig00112738pilonHSYRG01007 [Hibiscus syriacus]